MEWSCGDDGDDDDDDDDDDPDEVQLDDGDDGDVFHPPGRNFPSRFLPAGELFSLCCFPSAEAAENSLDGSVGLRVSGGRSTPKGAARCEPGAPHPV